jgi:periplasmic divalent cation tolerance protein
VDQIALLYTTWPDAETAERAAEAAVAARLAACVNILGSGRSIYRWGDGIEAAVETIAFFKTTVARADDLSAFIIANHPYNVPAVVSVATMPTGSSPDFLAWVADQASLRS